MRMFNCKDEKLVAFILERLDKACYDPDGNSTNAILARRRDSYWKSVKWHTVELIKSIFDGIKDLSLDTTIGEFVALSIAIIGFPLLPFISEYMGVRRAIKHYEVEYQF